MISTRELILRKRVAAEAQVKLCDELLDDLDGEEAHAAAATAGAGADEDAPAEGDEEEEEGEEKARAPAAGTAAERHLPTVAKALVDGPLSRSDLERATGFSAMKLSGVLNVYGPSANGKAYFEKESDTKFAKWRLTAKGRKEFVRGES